MLLIVYQAKAKSQNQKKSNKAKEKSMHKQKN